MRANAAALMSLLMLACAGTAPGPAPRATTRPPNPDHAKRSGDRPMPTGTVMLSPEEGASRRQVDLGAPHHLPSVRRGHGDLNEIVWGIYKVCVDTAGVVARVSTIRTSGDQVDHDWSDIIRTWRYAPHLLAGHPTPFCYPARFELLAD